MAGQELVGNHIQEKEATHHKKGIECAREKPVAFVDLPSFLSLSLSRSRGASMMKQERPTSSKAPLIRAFLRETNK